MWEYQAGATTEYFLQLADQEAGRKIKIPTHVLYSIANLGAQLDVPEIWRNYCSASAGVTVKDIGDEKGHFIIEEASGEF